MTGGDYLTQLGIAVLAGGGKGQGQIQLIWSEYTLLDPSPSSLSHSEPDIISSGCPALQTQVTKLADVLQGKDSLLGAQQTSDSTRIPCYVGSVRYVP